MNIKEAMEQAELYMTPPRGTRLDEYRKRKQVAVEVFEHIYKHFPALLEALESVQGFLNHEAVVEPSFTALIAAASNVEGI